MSSSYVCKKAPHVGGGYLHSEEDDLPYCVDGVRYCGRCHAWIGTSGNHREVEIPPMRFDTESLMGVDE